MDLHEGLSSVAVHVAARLRCTHSSNCNGFATWMSSGVPGMRMTAMGNGRYTELKLARTGSEVAPS